MENQNIEYKESWRDEYLRWICGFANAQGGKLCVGIDDRGVVCGVENAHRLSEDIPNKIVALLGVVADVNILNQEGKDYIEIEVAPSNVPISYKGKYYYRSGSTLQELNGVALQHFLLKKMGRSWDDIVNENAKVEDLDREAIDFFLRKGIQAGRIDPSEANATTVDVLQNLALMDENGHLKNAALLLFARDPRRYFTGTEFKIGRFHSNIADLVSQEMIEGSIIQMADRVVRMLKDKFLTMPIHYEGLQRIESLEVPEDALREIIYNAICHKDYLGPQIQMRVWDHHVEVWNDGELPSAITPENIEKVHASYPRNKNLAYVFYKAGFIESWGRGWQKICDGFQAAGLPKPTIESTQGGVLVTFQRNNVNLAKPSSAEVRDVADNVAVNVAEELTERQRFIIELVKKGITDNVALNVAVNTKYLSQKLNVNRKTIQRDIAYLQERKLLQWVGSDKTGHWEIIGE